MNQLSLLVNIHEQEVNERANIFPLMDFALAQGSGVGHDVHELADARDGSRRKVARADLDIAHHAW